MGDKATPVEVEDKAILNVKDEDKVAQLEGRLSALRGKLDAVSAMDLAVADDAKAAKKVGLQVAPLPEEKGRFDGVEKELLFSIDDTDYYIPKEIPPSIVWGYLKNVRRGGAEMAFAEMFISLLGEEALDDLATYDDMTTQEMKALIKALQRRVLGALEMGN